MVQIRTTAAYLKIQSSHCKIIELRQNCIIKGDYWYTILMFRSFKRIHYIEFVCMLGFAFTLKTVGLIQLNPIAISVFTFIESIVCQVYQTNGKYLRRLTFFYLHIYRQLNTIFYSINDFAPVINRIFTILTEACKVYFSQNRLF